MTVNGISISPFPSISIRFIFIVIVVLFCYFHLPSIRLLFLSIHYCMTTYLLILYFISFSSSIIFNHYPSSSLFVDISIFHRLAFFQHFSDINIFTVQPSSNLFRISIFLPSSLLPEFYFNFKVLDSTYGTIYTYLC